MKKKQILKQTLAMVGAVTIAMSTMPVYAREMETEITVAEDKEATESTGEENGGTAADAAEKETSGKTETPAKEEQKTDAATGDADNSQQKPQTEAEEATEEVMEDAKPEMPEQIQAQDLEEEIIPQTKEKSIEDVFQTLEEVQVDAGWYTLQMFTKAGLSVDIKSASDSNGAGVQIWADNNSLAQRFYIAKKQNGWYSMKNISSGKVITLTEAAGKKGTKLQQWQETGEAAQEFKFYRDKKGAIVIRPNAGKNLVLDISGGILKNGSRVQLYEYNGTAAQQFRLQNNTIPGEETNIPSGKYRFYPTAAAGLSLDVAGGSTAKGANVRLYKRNNTAAQEWTITKQGEWYKLKNVKSGKVLDTKGGSSKSGANIQQWTANTGKGQLFKFYKIGENRYYLMSKLGTVLDVAGGVLQSGSNVQMYKSNRSKAQEWGIEKILPPSIEDKKEVQIAAGDYSIYSEAGSNMVMDIKGGSKSSKANVQIYSMNWSAAQSYSVQKQSDGWYTIKNKGSNLCLDVAGGSSAAKANLWQYKANNSDAQKFKFYDAGSGRVFIKSKKGTVIDVSGGSAKKGTNIWMYTFNGSAAQKWVLKKETLADKIKELRAYVKTPYVWGGDSPSGWDCSGFTKWALRYLGATINGSSSEQARGGKAVDAKNMSAWKPGDLLVYTYKGNVRHVALYLGNGELMHALNAKRGTLIQKVSEYDKWDDNKLTAVRRYL